MTIFLIIAFILLFIGCWIVKFFGATVPLLETLLTPVTIACAIVGAAALVFTAIELLNKIKGKGKKDKD